MKLFLDTASVEDIARRNTGLITGITTNPTLIRKTGRNPDDVYQEIFDLGINDLSIEVPGEYFDEFICKYTHPSLKIQRCRWEFLFLVH